jgi:two-component sensor histidine kinase
LSVRDPEPGDGSRDDRRVSVLYVDDDAALARLVARYLSRQGYSVTTASDVKGGLDRVRSGGIDVVAVDHFMPGQDGLDLLIGLKGLDDPPPAIYVTASDEGRVAVSALKLGAADYVIKDVQGAFLDLLDRAIRQAVDNARDRRAKEAAERELRESRDRLAALLEQKTALLHEVSHRVSNSLQLIVSLISIQASRIADPAARDALLQARERVQAVMLVHRRLYTSDEVQSIEIDKYLQAMAEELQAGILAADQKRRIMVAAEPLRIATDKAVSLGVIVNELVTNALKYAFPGANGGTIRVTLAASGDNAVLTVEDDGVGYAPDATPRGTGLGTLIVGAMAKTLQGAIERQTVAVGSRTLLTFPMR